MQWGWGQKQRGMSIWQIIKRWLGAGANPDRPALPDAATTPATAAPWRHWHSPQPSPALRRVAVIGPAHGPLSGDARTLAQALAQLGLQMAEAPNTQTLLAQVIATPLEWRFVLVDCAPGPVDMAQNQALAAFHASCPSVPLIALAEASTLKNLQAPGGLPWVRILENRYRQMLLCWGLGRWANIPTGAKTHAPQTGRGSCAKPNSSAAPLAQPRCGCARQVCGKYCGHAF